MSILAALCLGAFFVALALTALARRYALWRQLVDAPGERRSHVVATPRGGGIAIVAVVLPAMVWLGTDGVTQPVFLLGALGLLLVAGIGWVDDHRPLSPWSRLLVHLLSAMLLAAGVLWAEQPAWWAAVVFLLALGLVNVWNFMDGIDGIAASQAALVAGALALLGLMGGGVALACMFVAACLGFLPLSAFLIDAALTLLSRIIRGERWWTPHVQHMYQRWVQAGHAHAVVTGGYAAWTLLSILVAIWMAGAPQPVIIGAFATWYLLGVTIWLTFRARHNRARLS